MKHTRLLWAPGLAIALVAMSPAVALASDEPVKVSSASALKGVQTLVVGAFNVGFIFQSVDSTATTGGMIGAFGGVTKAKSELSGVTPAMMQAITDAAYADFQAQLAARGFTVVEPASMFAHPEFKRVKIEQSPMEVGVQLDKKSTGKATYYKPTALAGQFMLPGDITASGFGGMGIAMSAGTNQYGLSQYARAASQAVVDVTYLIDFSDAHKPGAFSFGGITVNSTMSVVGNYSKASVVTAEGKVATLTLKEPVAVAGDFVTMEDTTKGAGVQQAANIMGGLLAARGIGGFKFGKTKTYTCTAKPGLYEQGATKAATLANERVIGQLAALR